MSFLKKFASMFSGPSQPTDWSYWIVARCNKCGEVIRNRVDLRNDLSIEYGEKNSDTTYFCRKTLIGNQRCYQPIEVELTFDHNHKPVDRKIRGGEFVDA